MVRIYDPGQLTHPTLREFAVMAAWISVPAETIQELEDLNVDLTLEERALPDFRKPWPRDFGAVSLAQFVVTMNREEAEKGVEELLAAWLSEDRENWPVLRLTLIDPWQERPGIWSEQTPEWVRILATCVSTEQEKYAPFGRRPTS